MTRRRPVRIQEVVHPRDPAFSAALRLYNRVFPDKERIERSYFTEILREKALGLLQPFNAHFLVGRLGARVVGLATGTYLAGVNMGFVGYLAVDPRLKRARLGSRLRARLVELMCRDAELAGRAPLNGVMGEVEKDNPWLRTLVRRGALALDLDYLQPALGSQHRAVPLVLYLQSLGEPVQRLPVARLRTLLYAIYRRVYRIRFPLRQRPLRKMLKALEGRRTVGPLRLSGPARARA